MCFVVFRTLVFFQPNTIHYLQSLEDEECGIIYLHPLLEIARRIRLLLSSHNCKAKYTLLTFEIAYRQFIDGTLEAKKCGNPGVSLVLQVNLVNVRIRY